MEIKDSAYETTESGLMVPKKQFILFEEDFDYYPTADIDLTTKNQSFVRLASVYRDMGVKNNVFHLALINQNLRGVDPFDPDLDETTMKQIYYECLINPWFFFREIARAPATSGVGSDPLQANRGNIALWWCFFNHVMVFLIQIRQTGKSFSTDQLMSYLMNILCRNTAINLLTKDDNLRRANVKRLKDIMAELPKYLNFSTKDDARNGEEITIMRLNNRYNTHVPQASEKNALKLGRGLTTPIFHIDEPPFQPHIETALPAALAATGNAVDKAKARGEPYGTILTTTAGKKDDRDGKYVYKLLQDAAVWNERFFDAKNHAHLEQIIRASSRKRSFMVNITLNHRQLGKSDEWLRTKLDESKAVGEDADRDYFNVWTSGTNTSPFSADMAERIRRGEKEVKYTYIDPVYGYVIRFYIPEAEVFERLSTGRFTMGMDPSEAGGGDDISLVLVDVESLEVLGAGTYNDTNVFNLANWICDFLVTFKNITAIIERRSIGAALIDQLLWLLPEKGEDPFKRLFNMVVQERMENKDRFKEIEVPLGRRPEDIYVRYKKTFGFATSGSGQTARSSLYGLTMSDGLRMAADRMNDKTLIDQVLALEIRNGRVDHAPGEHDDMVIGWLLCIWLLTKGTTLSFYGMDSRLTLSKIQIQRGESQGERLFREEQEALRERIRQICDAIADEKDDFVVMRLEDQLRMLESRLVVQASDVHSIDELIRQAKERKADRYRQRSSGVLANAYQGSKFYGSNQYLGGHISTHTWNGREF